MPPLGSPHQAVAPPEDPTDAAGPSGLERRDFLIKAAAMLAAGVAFPWGGLDVAVLPAQTSSAGATDPAVPAFAISPQADEDVLIRMQRDLARALRKPIEQRRWGMVIDTRKCVACMSCTVACVMENKLPPGVVYRPVIDTEIGTYPNVTRQFLPRPCMQCDNPPCVSVCPVNATWKRPDGIIEIDYDVCIGCRYCITACPYQARTFDFGENWTNNAATGAPAALALAGAAQYENEPNFEYSERWNRANGPIPTSPVGNARKCHFCAHRLVDGLLPMCVTTCLGRATIFGDLNDPEALVTELAASSNAIRLKEDLGTEPKVFYLL